MKHHYCVIIGDIDKSRTLQRRARIQEKFKEAVAAINKEFKNDIASKFLITLGDEFQGVLLTPQVNTISATPAVLYHSEERHSKNGRGCKNEQIYSR